SPMHDLTGTYPHDFYGPNGFRYYADMGNGYDRKSYSKSIRAKGKPDDKVAVFRAIPKTVYSKIMKSTPEGEAPLNHLIKKGDWVTTSKEYAKEHGEANLNNDFKIVHKYVPAKHLYTNGDSIHEWGYYPEEDRAGKAEGGGVEDDHAKNLAKFMKGSHSSTLNKDGTPKVFYHGTKGDIGNVFDTSNRGLIVKGAYFTTDPEEAHHYATNASWNIKPNIIPVHLKMTNPYIMNKVNGMYTKPLKREELIAKGHDGIILNNEDGTAKWGIAFHPHQIKSAIGNRGTYDPNDPDITKAEGGDVEVPHEMGINVASDLKAGRHYADLIVDGHKKYESRETDSLRPYVGKHMSIVRTGAGKSKAIGSAHIGEPIIVDENRFRELEPEHMVTKGSTFDIKPGQKKYLYPISNPSRYSKEYDVDHGIVARKVRKADGGGVEDDHPKQMKMTSTFYHGTHSDFPAFDPNQVDIGTHVGSKEQAINRLRHTANPFGGKSYGDYGYRAGANVIPLKANLGKSLELYDVGMWKDSHLVADALVQHGFNDLRGLRREAEETKHQFGDYEDFLDSPENRSFLDELNGHLRSKGYDSIKYKNAVENEYGSDAIMLPEAA
ncbi:MAG: hypothetical protein ACO29O_05935, partial [Chitinophagaceae bacterium]